MARSRVLSNRSFSLTLPPGTFLFLQLHGTGNATSRAGELIHLVDLWLIWS